MSGSPLADAPSFVVLPGGLPDAGAPQVSVIVPAYNEVESLALLASRVRDVFERAGRSFEIVFVDDGSTDGSAECLTKLHGGDPRVRARILDGRWGKSAALDCGIAAARGEVLVFMDADLQDLPEEVELLLAPIEAGELDLVQGWRRARSDTPFKVFASAIFNRLVSWSGGLVVRDVNCGYKAMRRAVARSLHLGDDMHRFVPVLAHRNGFRVGEVPVRHAARAFGRSRYGFARYLRGFSDILVVLVLPRVARALAPGLGTAGALLLLVSAASFAGLAISLLRGAAGYLLELGLIGFTTFLLAMGAFALSWWHRFGERTLVAGPRRHPIRTTLG